MHQVSEYSGFKYVRNFMSRCWFKVDIGGDVAEPVLFCNSCELYGP